MRFPKRETNYVEIAAPNGLHHSSFRGLYEHRRPDGRGERTYSIRYADGRMLDSSTTFGERAGDLAAAGKAPRRAMEALSRWMGIEIQIVVR